MSGFVKMLKRLKRLAEGNNLVVHDVYPDGNCMFGAVVDQLRIRGMFSYTIQNLRQAAVDYLRAHPYSSVSFFLILHFWSCPEERGLNASAPLVQADLGYNCLIWVIFYAPTSIDRGHIVFGLSICLFLHLSICLSTKTSTLAIAFEW